MDFKIRNSNFIKLFNDTQALKAHSIQQQRLINRMQEKLEKIEFVYISRHTSISLNKLHLINIIIF